MQEQKLVSLDIEPQQIIEEHSSFAKSQRLFDLCFPCLQESHKIITATNESRSYPHSLLLNHRLGS